MRNIPKPPQELKDKKIKLLGETFTFEEAYKFITLHPDVIGEIYNFLDPEYDEDDDFVNEYLRIKHRINDLCGLNILTKDERIELDQLSKEFDALYNGYIEKMLNVMAEQYLIELNKQNGVEF